jgi:NAD(P)-dependent dehydrogenase (short-subunit alcohol dehydrogenase family)
LVTGAAGTLGTALCEALVQDFHIIGSYRNRRPKFPWQDSQPISIHEEGGREGNNEPPYCVQADVTVREDIRRLIEVARAKYGSIDVLINCAADVKFHGKLVDLCYFRQAAVGQLGINCIAPIELVSTIFHEVWKNERSQNANRNRCVINISSISGLYIFDGGGQALYGTSKAALNFLTLHLAAELAPYSVRANAICPVAFPDSIPTNKVVQEIRCLMDGHATGELVEVTSKVAQLVS